MRINLRLVGCFVLGYTAVQMFRPAPEEDAMHPALRIGIATVFMGFAVVIGIITLRQNMANKRAEQNKEAGQALEEEAQDGSENEGKE